MASIPVLTTISTIIVALARASPHAKTWTQEHHDKFAFPSLEVGEVRDFLFPRRPYIAKAYVQLISPYKTRIISFQHTRDSIVIVYWITQFNSH